ncbi:hypothetical protein ABZ760_29980 [Streptomyces sp. NPDC006658]|uniref:hypothetical protein n=1 Tax=Streptomyces sp. NPDC006658 TaxID=3156900 RepID=UPI0033F47F4B
MDDRADTPEPAAGERWTVEAVVLDQDGRAFARKRGPGRRLIAGRRDIVGGHIGDAEQASEAVQAPAGLLFGVAGGGVRRRFAGLAALEWFRTHRLPLVRPR